MSLVAAETEVQSAAPAVRRGDDDWKLLGLYMSGLESYVNEAVVDVLKMSTRSAKLKNVPVPSISNSAWQARDELSKDPYSLKKINNLGHIYWREGQHDQCLNVMMRGWKRAGEIKDRRVAFHFLMKLCELSSGFWKYRQALAVFRDIEEPLEPKELKAYLILGTQVWCNNGDLSQGLKFFQRAIDNESFELAVRIFAVVSMDLKKAGAYEAAKSTMENLSPEHHNTNLAMIDAFVECSSERKAMVTPEMLQRRLMIGAVVAGLVVLTSLLHWLESRSLAAMKL